MSYVLGKPFMVGHFGVAIVCRQVLSGRVTGRFGVAVQCSKRPAFVLVQDGQGRVVLDMTGAPVALEEVSALCPEVADCFTGLGPDPNRPIQ